MNTSILKRGAALCIASATLSLASLSYAADTKAAGTSSTETKAAPKTPEIQAPAATNPMVQLQSLKQHIQGLSNQLQGIQQGAIEGDEALQSQQSEVEAAIDKAMADNGYDAKPVKARLAAIAEIYNSGKASDEEKQTLGQEYQQKSQELQQAQQQVKQNADVQKLVTHFRDSLVEAMNEENPKTQTIINQLQQAQAQYQALAQQLMQQHVRQPAAESEG